MNQKTDTFVSVSSNPPSSFSSIDNDFDLYSMISPTVLLYITLLSIIFFFAALIHLLVRFLLRPRTRLDDPYEDISLPEMVYFGITESSTFLQDLFQTRVNCHNSGVDQSFIDALPLFHYKTKISLRHDPFDCAVCLSDFRAEDELRLLPKCSHAFHVNCIDTWLLTNSTCPLCRDNLLGHTTSYSTVDLVHEADGQSSRDSDSQLMLIQLDEAESKLGDISGLNDESKPDYDETCTRLNFQ